MYKMKKKIKRKYIAIGIALMLVSIMIQPVAAWGSIAHIAITNELKEKDDIPNQVIKYSEFTRGGAIGTDMFYFLPGYEDYSVLAHTENTADLSREMLRLADTGPRIFRDQKKAYAYGWLSHHADLIGHTEYVNIKVNKLPIHSHEEVELGVDANLAGEVQDSMVYVPYKLVQTAYKNTYQVKPPELATMIGATTLQQTVIYIERVLILAGAFDNLKSTYIDFNDFNEQKVYDNSILYSESAIKSPDDLENCNLYIGGCAKDPSTGVIVTSIFVSSSLNKAYQNKVDPDIRDAANELLRKGVIKVPVQDDKINEVLKVEEPVIIDKKAFDDAIAELIKKKKDKK
jgi:hypothetical protein